MIDWEINTAELTRLAVEIDATAAQAKAALKSTLGKMANWLRVRSLKGLSAELRLQQKIIRRRLKSLRVKETPDGSSVTVWYGLDPVALIYLNARETAAGVSASGGRQVSKGFIAGGKGGGKQVFKRIGKSRLPIKKQADAIKTPADGYLESQLVTSAAFEIQFFKTYEHELAWRMQTQN